MSLRFVNRPNGYHFGCFAQVQFEPRDFSGSECSGRVEHYKGSSDGWDIGRVREDHFTWPWTFHLYVYLIPMFPLHVSIMRKRPVRRPNGDTEA